MPRTETAIAQNYGRVLTDSLPASRRSRWLRSRGLFSASCRSRRIGHLPRPGRRLGRLVYFEDEPGRRSAAKLLKLSFKKDGTCTPVPSGQ